jgi:hypothetical protein
MSTRQIWTFATASAGIILFAIALTVNGRSRVDGDSEPSRSSTHGEASSVPARTAPDLRATERGDAANRPGELPRVSRAAADMDRSTDSPAESTLPSPMKCCPGNLMADVVMTLRFVGLRIACNGPLAPTLCDQLNQTRGRFARSLQELELACTEIRNVVVDQKIARDDCEFFVDEPDYSRFVAKNASLGRTVRLTKAASFAVDTRGHWPLLHAVSKLDPRTGIRVTIRAEVNQGDNSKLDLLVAKRNEIWMEKAMHYSALLSNLVLEDREPTGERR